MDAVKHITRRSAIVGIAAAGVSLPALAVEKSSQMAQLIEAHRNAAALLIEISAVFDRLCDQHPKPDKMVIIGVDHYTKEPCRWVRSDYQVDREVEVRRGYMWGANLDERLAEWAAAKKAQLASIQAERDRIDRESGLDVLHERLMTVEDAEFDALKSFIVAVPADMAEVRSKAAYLAELHAKDEMTLGCWIDKLLAAQVEAGL